VRHVAGAALLGRVYRDLWRLSEIPGRSMQPLSPRVAGGAGPCIDHCTLEVMAGEAALCVFIADLRVHSRVAVFVAAHAAWLHRRALFALDAVTCAALDLLLVGFRLVVEMRRVKWISHRLFLFRRRLGFGFRNGCQRDGFWLLGGLGFWARAARNACRQQRERAHSQSQAPDEAPLMPHSPPM
jgi:hypothetical protein